MARAVGLLAAMAAVSGAPARLAADDGFPGGGDTAQPDALPKLTADIEGLKQPGPIFSVSGKGTVTCPRGATWSVQIRLLRVNANGTTTDITTDAWGTRVGVGNGQTQNLNPTGFDPVGAGKYQIQVKGTYTQNGVTRPFDPAYSEVIELK